MIKSEFRQLDKDSMLEFLLTIFEDEDGALYEMTKKELVQFGVDNWDAIESTLDVPNEGVVNLTALADEEDDEPDEDEPEEEEADEVDPDFNPLDLG